MYCLTIAFICFSLLISCFAQENEFRGELSLDSEPVEWPIGEAVSVEFTTSWPSVWLGAWEDDSDSAPIWLLDDEVPTNGFIMIETLYPEGVELFTNPFRLWVEEVDSEGSSTGLSFSSTQIRAVNSSSASPERPKPSRTGYDKRPVAATSTSTASTTSASSRKRRTIALGAGIGVGIGSVVLIVAFGSWGIIRRRRKRAALMEVMGTESEMRQPLTH